MIPRTAHENLTGLIRSNRLISISGPRNVGKITLVKNVLAELNASVLFMNATVKKDKNRLDSYSLDELKELVQPFSYLLIERVELLPELQRLIDWTLDGELACNLILLSAFTPNMDELIREVIEVNGLNVRVYAPSFHELARHFSISEMENQREQRLIYGHYPEVIQHPEAAKGYLIKVVDDLIEQYFGSGHRVNKTNQLQQLLRVVAFHIGEPLSYHEIGQQIQLDNETVERYVHLLVEAQILIRLPSFYTGQRYELKKSNVFYFWDNGIRNGAIQNFNPMNIRNDQEMLWKNWLIAERMKWNAANKKEASVFFWRSHTRQTIDYMEVLGEEVSAYKIAWDKKRKVKFSPLFLSYYPASTKHVVNHGTYWSFLTKK
jgi:predicted AAA+ superfamily ATPase